jgi:spore germination protein GerM
MPTKKRRKSGKYAPLIWVVTGALIAFFISYSGSLKNINLLQNSGPKTNSNNFSLTNFFNPGKSAQSIQSSLIITNAVSLTSDKINIKIFLARQTGDEVRLEAKTVQIQKSPSLLKDTLEALVQYRGNDVLNLVPLNTKIRKVWIKNDIAYIDFNEDFSYNSYGIIGYKVQVYQIVYTATQFPQARAVYFYMEGKPISYLGGDGYLINNPIYPYSSLPVFSLQ